MNDNNFHKGQCRARGEAGLGRMLLRYSLRGSLLSVVRVSHRGLLHRRRISRLRVLAAESGGSFRDRQQIYSRSKHEEGKTTTTKTQ